jgi:CMP-N-acetylneuraminic acid synthetase
MKNNPLVTIYITNYNYGKFIKQSIESALNQSLQDFELLIIDDGSTDNSKEIIETYRNHSQVTIIYQQNQGLNVTNNIAMRASRGKYIMRLDADDFLDPHALMILSDALERDQELGMVFPDYFLVDEHGNVLNVERRNSFKDSVSLMDMPAHGACTMIRKLYLESVGGYDEEFMCQDGYELWIKFSTRYKVLNVPTPLFYYRQHGKNLTSNEQRILTTRSRIKEKYLEKETITKPTTVAVLPVRETMVDSGNLAIKSIGPKRVLQHKIDELIQVKNLSLIVVSSPTEEIEELVIRLYGNNPKIKFHKRDESLARLNVGLAETIENVLHFHPVQSLSPDIIVTASVEFPFVLASEYDDAVNTLMLFNTDSLITVRADNSVFYQHHGSGMEAILGMDRFSKLERETLYRYAGGVIVTRTSAFRKSKSLITGVVGHTMVSQKSAHRIQTAFDLQVAERIANL